jgi:hypothetical protein
MHAAPPVRVEIDSSAWTPVLIGGLVLLAALALGLWLMRVAQIEIAEMAAAVISLAVAAVIAVAWRARAGRLPVVLSWDGQRWFMHHTAETDDAAPGSLRLHWDMDGRSLLRFVPAAPKTVPPRWLLATPATVRGSWQDWRAALVHSQRAMVLA